MDEYKGAINNTIKRGAKEKNEFRIEDDGLGELKEELVMDQHKVPHEALCMRYVSNLSTGLDPSTIEDRQKHEGYNKITPIPPIPEFIKFLQHMFGGISLLLWVAAVLCFIGYAIQAGTYAAPPSDNLYLGLVLLLIVILIGIFGYLQERKATKIMESFAEYIPKMATVVRGGEQMRIHSSELCRGDVIQVAAGDYVPADLRVITASPDFKVNNSSLTGEMEPQRRSQFFTNENPLETENLVFYSTEVVEGCSTCIVVSIGDETVIGKIANLASGNDELTSTPIHTELNHFMWLISVIALGLGIVFFIIPFYLNYTWLESIIFLLGIFVAQVPENLIGTVGVSLTLAARRMARRNCLIKHLEAVENLGAVSTICCDKGGVVTQNAISLAHLFMDGTVTELGINGDMDGFVKPTSPTFNEILFTLVNCSTAGFESRVPVNDISQWIIGANTSGTEAALLRFAEAMEGDVESKRHNVWPCAFRVPFTPSSKLEFSIHIRDGRYHLVAKGAPELILARCETVCINGQTTVMSDAQRDEFHKTIDNLAFNGERVLGLADFDISDSIPYDYHNPFPFQYKPPHKDKRFNHPEQANFPVSGLRFLGLISMVDPPRPGVQEAVKKCKEAGIRVIMISGDHPETAKAISQQVNIIDPGSETREDIAHRRRIGVEAVTEADGATAAVITGAKLEEMDKRELDRTLAAYSELVFARVTPAQKVYIIEALQRGGELVASTGRSVNDAPALKRADVGVSLGISGCDVARNAADVVLLDDNFASIVSGIEEGRTVFDNLKKSVAYTLSSNIPEILPFFIWIIFDFPTIVNPVIILAIDLGTDLYPSVSFAYEPAESDTMKRPPRDPKVERLIDQKLVSYSYGQLGMLQFTAGLFAAFVVLSENGWWPYNLYGVRTAWDSPVMNDVEDSYGQQWSVQQRAHVRGMAQTAFFIAVVECQWFAVFSLKTRRQSLFTHGIRGNNVMWFAVIFETLLAVLFVYLPGMDMAMGTRPLKFWWWLPALPFCVVIVAYDELRKFILRRVADNPDSFWNELYY